MGSVGVVIGATVGQVEIQFENLNGPILAPGFGAQGGTVADLRAVFGPELATVLPSTSRDVLRHGPDQRLLRDAALRVRDVVVTSVAAH
jgi:orotidine-5'-phosphate decarboxylase